MSTETKRRPLVIAGAERLRNSANGNPRYLITFTDGTTAKTGSDSTIGNMIENFEYQGADLEVTFRDGDIVRVEIL